MKKSWIVLALALCVALGGSMLFSASAAEETVTAYSNASRVLVDGKEVQFDAYTVFEGSGGTNYFKLRDIAYVLSGTQAQFDVTWDSAAGSIRILTGEPYTVAGGELSAPSGEARTAFYNRSPIYLDDAQVQIQAYTIAQNNYFKLRDLGNWMGFGVDWDQESQSILITSDPASQPSTTPTPTPTPAADVKAEVVRLVNEERAKEGLAPLSTLPELDAAADVRAPEVAEYFSHDRPDGTSCFTVLSQCGVSGYRSAGENIARGYPTAEAVVEGWMNSEGHRANILNGNFTHIGVGYQDGAWVQLFIGK